MIKTNTKTVRAVIQDEKYDYKVPTTIHLLRIRSRTFFVCLFSPMLCVALQGSKKSQLAGYIERVTLW